MARDLGWMCYSRSQVDPAKFNINTLLLCAHAHTLAHSCTHTQRRVPTKRHFDTKQGGVGP